MKTSLGWLDTGKESTNNKTKPWLDVYCTYVAQAIDLLQLQQMWQQTVSKATVHHEENCAEQCLDLGDSISRQSNRDIGHGCLQAL